MKQTLLIIQCMLPLMMPFSCRKPQPSGLCAVPPPQPARVTAHSNFTTKKLTFESILKDIVSISKY